MCHISAATASHTLIQGALESCDFSPSNGTLYVKYRSVVPPTYSRWSIVVATYSCTSHNSDHYLLYTLVLVYANDLSALVTVKDNYLSALVGQIESESEMI